MMDPDASDEDSCDDRSFEKAFSPLAYHLFPDGVSQSDLSAAWPHRDDRRPVSVKDAQLSIRNLYDLSSRYGLISTEMWVVTFVACATLPSSQTVLVNTPLMDGTSTYFQSILRCLIPVHGSKMTSNIVVKLLGVQCDSLARRSVLRLLTGAFRNGWLDLQAENALLSLYGVVFSMIFDHDICSDAVRLLYFITKESHVRVDRMNRMKRCFEESLTGDTGKSPVAPILLLLHLYGNFDPVRCSKHIPVTNQVKLAALYRKLILKELSTVTKKRRGRPKKRTKMDQNSSTPERGWIRDSLEGIVSRSWRNDFNESSWKASDLLSNERLRCLASLEGTLPSAEIVRMRSSIPFLMYDEWYGSFPFQHNKHDDDMEDVEDEEHFERGRKSKSGETETITQEADKRLPLLANFASFASHTGALLPEMELFLVNEVVPNWDGTDAIGRVLCFDLVPFLSPTRFGLFETRVLRYLEQFLVYGGPRLQYMVLTGALGGLVRRWGRIDWSQVETLKDVQMKDQSDNHDVFKQVTLGKLIQWTDRTILKALLFQKDNHLLLSLAALDFFKSVAKLTNHNCPYLIAPSPALVYHLLISPSSAVVVDGICQLLVDYKGSFQQLKALEEFRRDSQPVCGMESVTVFNSFIWDFCNVLWKCIFSWNEDGKDPVASLLLSHLPPQSRQALQLHGENAASALSIVQGSLFVGYVDRFCESIPTSTSSSLVEAPFVLLHQGNLKLKYFDFLQEECGLRGLGAFLTTFAGSLAQRREGQRKNDETS